MAYISEHKSKAVSTSSWWVGKAEAKKWGENQEGDSGESRAKHDEASKLQHHNISSSLTRHDWKMSNQ